MGVFTSFALHRAPSSRRSDSCPAQFHRFHIHGHQRGLHFRNGGFLRLLPPGDYRLWSRFWARGRDRIEVVDTRNVRFQHPLLDLLLADSAVRSAIAVLDLAESQRARVWADEHLYQIAGPGRYAFWKAPHALRVEIFEVGGIRSQPSELRSMVAGA